jgi:uncharacterized RDD family membrane protein YckC/RNA polymerase subunit RPABC4/transcription elongation factor Spt4
MRAHILKIITAYFWMKRRARKIRRELIRMSYCEKCGSKIAEETTFCPNCGANVKAPSVAYRRPRSSGRNYTTLLAVFFGGIIIIASLGLLAGGGMVMWAQSTFRDPDGFLISGEVKMQVDSHALVHQGVDIDVDVPSYVWQPDLGDLVTIKLVGTSNDPSKPVFIGIAREGVASEYLSSVEYDEVVDFTWSYDRWREHQPALSYDTHHGGAPSQAPATEIFWEASITGSGTQTLEWEPEVGNFWFVVMNADGSSDVDVDMQLGAKIPFLRYIGNMMFAGGFISLMVGGLIIFLGAIRPQRSWESREMPFCRNCGNEVSEEAEYCPSCGTVVASADQMLASWGERFIAWLIDLTILSVLLSWMVWPGFYWLPEAWGTTVPRWIPFVDLGFKNLIYFLYWTILEGTYGQSVGKMVMKIKVVHLDEQALDISKAAYQSIGKAFLLPLDCILGWIQYSSRQQRLFNYLSKTVVVKTSDTGG